VRRDQRRRRRLLPAELAELAAAPEPEPNEQVQRLLEKVQQLRPVDRALVVAWLEGLDHAAIGEVLGIGAAGVATRWWRLKERLQRELEPDAETR